MARSFDIFCAFVCALLLPLLANGQDFNIGVGISDCTGPAGDVIMMGYANLGQDTRGIHTRLYSRAYIFVERSTSKRLVFASIDIAFVTQNIKVEVMKRLSTVYGNLYHEQNVALSGTHSHSGPGGYADYVLFQITSLGYVEDNFIAIVEGIVQSIIDAHNNIKPAYGYLNAGDLFGANINRSPYSYEQNPAEERAQYATDTDTLMTQLKIIDTAGNDMGLINWFAVHPVSMNNTNHLISSDHKGAASMLFEQMINGVETLPGTGSFVAAFASSNLGDVSPAIRGTFCTGGRRPGLRCEYETSTCPNWLGNPTPTLCHGQGPAGKDSKENTRMIAELQFVKANELYQSTSQIPLRGSLEYRHMFVDMPSLMVRIGEQDVKLCKASMGYSFAAGTTDGPGMFLFKQGDTTGNPYWDFVRDFIKEPTPETIECQKPKPIFFATGEMKFPHDWQADVIDLQLLKIGNLVIIVVPGELTTMSGRRLRNAVRQVLIDGGAIPEDSFVVISGLANTYADYFTTFEEYQVQRYEAASTIFGPNSLMGLIQEFSRMADSMVKNTTLPTGPTPPVNGRQLSFVRDPREDTLPAGASFGGVYTDVSPSYAIGQEVMVSFWAGNPRNNVQLGGSFLFVQRFNGSWINVRSDANWDTEFKWEVISERGDPQQSLAHIHWFTDKNAIPGQYRILYQGHWRNAQNVITPFVGYSSTFVLNPADETEVKIEEITTVEKYQKANGNSNQDMAASHNH